MLGLIILCLGLLGSTSAQFQPHCADGRDGQVLVHLFSWKWNDITRECENVLGPKGFCGVQVSPPNEHRIVTSPNRPWWERYQPVSWKLDSASGSRQEFINMVDKCNAVGVRIYIDAVINHMAGVDSGTGHGSGGSYYNTQNMQFDGVPFSSTDFGDGCTTASGNIENYNDVNQVRNCRLLGLLDLKMGSDYVRGKIASYFDDMLDIGIDGYRLDAAKHMWPGDIEAILQKTKNSKHGGKPFVFQEVIDLYGSEPIKSTDYTHIGPVTEFKYGLKMGEIFHASQVALTHLKNFGQSWGMLSSGSALVFVDNHDNQRGHGGGGDIITHMNPRAYKMAVAFMLSWPYGIPRVMSSYGFDTDVTGPPGGDMGTGGTCTNGWICEHRWRQVTNMVAWRNTAGWAHVENWWSNGHNQIAYSRGGKSFIAFNKDDGHMDEWVTTGLPAGTYCDVISGDLVDGQCTGKTINVNGDSSANIKIDGSSEDPIVAFHAGSRVGSGSGSTGPVQEQTTPSRPSVDPPAGLQRTVVLLKKSTLAGENVFMRGGCGTSATCSVPIQYLPKTGDHYINYMSWASGDTTLNWSGAERGQGSSGGIAADGSPMYWTSSSHSSPGYDSENSFGDHYWMWDVHMDCSQTSNGYFEIKGYLSGQWEPDVSQESCSGQRGINPLSSSNNHVARCGYKNVFVWGSNACTMSRLQTSTVVGY